MASRFLEDTLLRETSPALAGRRRLAETERVYLREVLPSDVEDNYHRWMSDPDVTRYLECRFYPGSKEDLRNYVVRTLGDRAYLFLAIVRREADRHIGNIKLGPIQPIHRSAEIGLLIGERDCWGQGYATEAIRLIAGYAFETLNLRKLTAGCYSSNPGSARAFVKAGFAIEAVRKSQFYCEGAYVDNILLGKVRQEEGSPMRPGVHR